MMKPNTKSKLAPTGSKVVLSSTLNPDLYKRQICKYYKNGEDCKFGDNCSFAHGEKELRPFVT